MVVMGGSVEVGVNKPALPSSRSTLAPVLPFYYSSHFVLFFPPYH